MPSSELTEDKNSVEINAAAIAMLQKFADVKNFYEGIGNMTRMVHSATRSLDELSGKSPESKIEINKQPNTNFLGYVRELTSDSASQVLDKLEQSSPVIDRLQRESDEYSEEIADYIADKCSKLEDSELKVLLLRVQSHLKANHRLVEELAQTHGDILTLQSYQDLTSQAITKAEKLLFDIESTMVNLLKSFSSIEGFELLTEEKELFKGAGSADATDDCNLVAKDEKEAGGSEQLGQDDVDALLSELGF